MTRRHRSGSRAWQRKLEEEEGRGGHSNGAAVGKGGVCLEVSVGHRRVGVEREGSSVCLCRQGAGGGGWWSLRFPGGLERRGECL